jgi:hypothetical protein
LVSGGSFIYLYTNNYNMSLFNTIRKFFGYQSQVTETEMEINPSPFVEPTVEEPVVMEPVVEEPVVEEPVVMEPVVMEPVVEEPTITPVPEELAVEEPIVPIVEEVKVKKTTKKRYYPKKKKAKNA